LARAPPGSLDCSRGVLRALQRDASEDLLKLCRRRQLLFQLRLQPQRALPPLQVFTEREVY
jgi:hypothetical protein